MKFIVLFNIVILVLVLLDLLVIVYASSVCPKEKANKELSEKKYKELIFYRKVKFYSYIVFFSIVVLMVIVNLIF